MSRSSQSDWLKWVADRDPTAKSGKSGHNCLIVNDYIDLSEGADNVDELLCFSPDGIVFVDLGRGTQDQNLIINSESGTVYVNGHSVNYRTGIQYLNDGSWGIKFGRVDCNHTSKKWLHNFIEQVYRDWLNVVYEKLIYLGIIKTSVLHQRSFWHLLTDDLPKGKIISRKSNKSA